mmetsp:Transcript_30158/g.70375  ORF Transcript_30158/g.70375 Transcript_30158/m.70375 type:complete len:285 (-) Transcript_30158:17-871(-)
MANRRVIEASIDSFWEAAEKLPISHKASALRTGKVARHVPPLPLSAREATAGAVSRGRSLRNSSTAAGACHSARVARAPKELELPPPGSESVTVELCGREGFNEAAVNGVWRFWRVEAGRLAFKRQVHIVPDEPDSPGLGEGDATAEAEITLYLRYVPEVDAWVVTDSARGDGDVLADCGPIGRDGEDLGQHWRVYDGSSWAEDTNILAEVSFPDSVNGGLSTLRVPAQSAASTPLAPLQHQEAPSRARSLPHRPSPRIPPPPQVPPAEPPRGPRRTPLLPGVW